MSLTFRQRLTQLGSRLDQLLFAEGDVHTAYVPWSDYNRTKAQRRIKEAVTHLLKPQRISETGSEIRKSRAVDPDTGLPLSEHPRDPHPDHPDLVTEEKPAFEKKALPERLAPRFGKPGQTEEYPIFTKGRRRYDVKGFLKTKFQIEGAPLQKQIEGLQHGIGTAGKTEQQVLEQVKSLTQQKKLRTKEMFEEYKQKTIDDIRSERGESKIDVKTVKNISKIHPRELTDRLYGKILPDEIQNHRRYMAREVGAVISPNAPAGQKFRSTGARALIKARGVNPAVAKAYPERLTEYNKRLEGLVEQHHKRATGILTHAEKHLDSWIGRGIEKSGDLPNAAPSEIARQATEWRTFVSHAEPTKRHAFIPHEAKEKLARYMSLGHPKGAQVSTQDVDRIKDRADSLLGRASTGANARQAILRNEKHKIFKAPLVEQVKGYPYLRKAGIGAGIAAGAIATGVVAKKLLSRKKEHNFDIDPDVHERIMRNVAMDFFQEEQRKIINPGKLTFPSEKKLGAMAMLRHLVHKGAIDPGAVAHLGRPTEWIKNPQQPLPGFTEPEIIAHQDKSPIPTMRDRWKDAEGRAARAKVDHERIIGDIHAARGEVEAEKTAREPLLREAHVKGYGSGFKTGQDKGFKTATVAATQKTEALTKEHVAKLRSLKRKAGWAGVGALGAGIAIGRLTKKNRSNKNQVPHEFASDPYWDKVAERQKNGSPELNEEDPQWLKDAARKTLYGRNYSLRGKAQEIKKWTGRTHRIIRDLKTKAQGLPSMDARGRPRKSEWERPWVTGAVTTGAIIGGLYGTRKAVQFVKARPLESRIGQLREGFLRANYAKKVPGLQKVGQFFRGVKTDIARMVDKPVKNPKYDFTIINPATGKHKSPGQLEKEVEKADNITKIRDIGAGRKKHPDEFSSKSKAIQLADLPEKPLTKRQKEKLVLEGSGAASLVAAAVILARRRGRFGGFGGGNVHVHVNPHGVAPHVEPPKVQPVYFSKRPDGKPSPAHDIAVGAIEGGLAYPASEWALRRVVGPKPSLTRKIIGGSVVGGLATGLVGLGLSRIVRGARHIKQQQKERQFAVLPSRTLVARDRYTKQIHEKDIDRASHYYTRAAGIGAGLGMLLRKKKPLANAIVTGAGAGIAAQGTARLISRTTKDQFGDRSWTGKRIDKTPTMAGGLTIGAIAARRLYKRYFQRKGRVIQFENRNRLGVVARDAAVGGAVGAAGTGALLGATGLALRGKAADLGHMLTTAAKQHVNVFNLRKSIPTFRSLPEASRLFGKQLSLIKTGEKMATSRSRMTAAGVKRGLSGVAYKDLADLRSFKKTTGATPSETMEKAVGMLSGVAATGVGVAGGVATSSGWKKQTEFAEKHPIEAATAAAVPGFVAGGLYRGTALQKGDDLTGRRVTRPHRHIPLLQHEGIGVGQGKIAELYHTPSMGKVGQIKIVSAEQFAKGGKISVLDEKVNRAAARRAAKQVGQKVPYSLLGRNCQIFAGEARSGLKRVVPRQLRNAIAVGGAAAAVSGATHAFGERTLKTGQIVRWGKHLVPGLSRAGRENLEVAGLLKSHPGTYSISDSATKASLVVRRGRGAYAEGSNRWWQKHNLNVEHLDLPAKFRKTREGGEALKKIHDTLLPHLDRGPSVKQPNRKGVTAWTQASAYEQTDPIKKSAETLDLVKRYEKRGFRKVADEYTPNEWGMTMKRLPGAKMPKQKTTEKGFRQYVNRVRDRNIREALGSARSGLSEVLPHAGVTATAATAATAAGVTASRDRKTHPASAATLIGAGGLTAGVLGLRHTPSLVRSARRELPGVARNLYVAADQARIKVGSRLALREGFGSGVGRRLLHGVV